jgi:hypothetical protein
MRPWHAYLHAFFYIFVSCSSENGFQIYQHIPSIRAKFVDEVVLGDTLYTLEQLSVIVVLDLHLIFLRGGRPTFCA